MSTTAYPSEDEESSADVVSDHGGGKLERLHAYLTAQTDEEGELYVKGKFIADDVGLSPKEIGQLMIELQDAAGDLEIEKWSYTGATTWRISPSTST